MAVDLLDVGGPVLVRHLEPAARLVLGLVLALHDGFNPYRLVGAQEDVQRAGVVLKDVGAPPADDDYVVGLGRLPDHLLGELENGAAGVENRVGAGRGPRGAGVWGD